MILKVNATRMELTRLKKELTIAIGGHKLLKDKRDEMMRQFIELKKSAYELRKMLEENINRASIHMAFAYAALGEAEFKSLFTEPETVLEVEKRSKNIMSLSVPEYRAKKEKDIKIQPYATTDFTEGAQIIKNCHSDLLYLAELEMSIKLLSTELEKTRRHVNSLEYVTIPNYKETIHYIRMRIEENTRSNTARLIKVKDMVIEEKFINKK